MDWREPPARRVDGSVRRRRHPNDQRRLRDGDLYLRRAVRPGRDVVPDTRPPCIPCAGCANGVEGLFRPMFIDLAYKSRAVRALVLLHDEHLRRFLVVWKQARAASVTLPQTDDPDRKSTRLNTSH